MGVTIHRILDKIDEYAIAELTHGSERMIAKVWAKGDALDGKVGVENLIVEIGYDQLLNAKMIGNFNDFDSSISFQKNRYTVKGRVIQVIKTDEDYLIDLYLQTGPDFVSIYKSEIGDLTLTEEQGVEIEISGLRFFPS